MPISVLDSSGATVSVPTLADVDFATQTTLAAVLAKLSADPATQTTLAALLAKVIAAPATEAKQDAILTALANLQSELNQKLETGGAVDVTFPATQPISAAALPLPTGASTETTTAAILAKLTADPATQTTLAAILAKLIAAPSTEAKQDAQTALLTTIDADSSVLASVVKAEDSASADGDAGIVILAQRRDTDSTAVSNDGDYAPLKTDEEGRLKVATKPASFADITGDITAIQATISTPVAGGTVSGDVSRASNVMAFCTGTFSTVNCTFEGSLEPSGDSNWFAVQAVRSNANTIETTTGNLSAQPAYAWELSVNALSRIRVRCTARTSGTQSWRFRLGTYATEPIPAAQVSATQPVSGTVTANIGTGSIAAGTNAIGDVGVQYRANATGAATRYHLVSAATTNAAFVKASAGRLVGWHIQNTNAAARFVKLHNSATAPTAGAAVVQTIGVPPNGLSSLSIPGGIGFSTGIAISTVTGSADADATAVGAGDLIIDLFYA